MVIYTARSEEVLFGNLHSKTLRATVFWHAVRYHSQLLYRQACEGRRLLKLAFVWLGRERAKFAPKDPST